MLCILWDERLLLVLFSVISGIGLYEYHHLFSSKTRLNYPAAISVIYGIVCFSSLVYPMVYGNQNGVIGFYQSVINFLILIALFVFFQFVYDRKHSISNTLIFFMGICYIIIPLYIGAKIHLNDQGDFPILMGVFLLVWTNDTFAYLSGNLFGKNKLYEKISPNKTWEGFVGGVVFTILLGYLFDLYVFNELESNVFMFWTKAAMIIAPAAVLGDLFESALKRKQNVKDTGNIMPGHGGILDRFDALFFAIPFFYLWHIFY